MNKRILDGGGLWKSDKLARIQPEWMRAEYANWIPLALANGVFEADTRRIWATVYSYNRPEITFEDAEDIKRELCRVGLLFLWADEQSGKVWAYFTGIDKSGRLPSKSRLDKKHEPIGPNPPVEQLRSYIELTRSRALESSMVSQWLANGCLGFGFGTGFGMGTGKGAKKNLAAKPTPPADSRYGPFLEFAKASFEAKHKHPPTWDLFGKDGSAVAAFLRRAAHVTLEVWQTNILNFFESTEGFTLKQGGSLTYFVSRFDTFSSGPLLASQGKENNAKPSVSENIRRTLETARITEQKLSN